MVIIRNIKISVEDKDKDGKPSMGDTVRIERGVGKKKHVTSMPVPKFLKSAELQFLGDDAARRELIGLPPKVDAKRFGARVKSQKIKATGVDRALSMLVKTLKYNYAVRYLMFNKFPISIEQAGKGGKEVLVIPLLKFLTDSKLKYPEGIKARLELLGVKNAKEYAEYIESRVAEAKAKFKAKSEEKFLLGLFQGLIQEASGSGTLDESRVKDLVAAYSDYRELDQSSENPFYDTSIITFLISNFPNDQELAFNLYNSIMERLGISDRLLMRAENSSGRIIESGGVHEYKSPEARGAVHHVDFILKEDAGTIAYTITEDGETGTDIDMLL